MSVEFENFYKVEQSPANAVALARADHIAHEGRGISEFVSALHTAEAQLRAFPDMLAALRLYATAAYPDEIAAAHEAGRAAIDKAEGRP